MTNQTQTTKLGDIVSGIYFDVPFTGKLVSFTSSGCQIDCKASPITVMGQVRDGVWLSNSDRVRNPLRVVESGPQLSDDDVVYQPGFTMYHLRAGL
jgi:hypothetical protein